jgi:hypothetical protein
MDKELKEKIAVNAANMWCRCFKCDGKVNATGCTCEKNKLLTCHKWYDGYRTALLALSEYEQQMMAKAFDAVVKIDAGGYPYVDRTIELYDYEQDIPLAKRGDKVKVIVIKEE